MSELRFAEVREALQYLSDYTGKRIKIAGNRVSREELVKFLIENPNPSDDVFHNFAEERGVDVHELESQAYALATEYAKKITDEK